MDGRGIWLKYACASLLNILANHLILDIDQHVVTPSKLWSHTVKDVCIAAVTTRGQIEQVTPGKSLTIQGCPWATAWAHQGPCLPAHLVILLGTPLYPGRPNQEREKEKESAGLVSHRVTPLQLVAAGFLLGI